MSNEGMKINKDFVELSIKNTELLKRLYEKEKKRERRKLRKVKKLTKKQQKNNLLREF